MVCFGMDSRGRDSVFAPGAKITSCQPLPYLEQPLNPPTPQAVHEHLREKHASYINICLLVGVRERECVYEDAESL